MMGGAASFIAPRYERVGRGACESCSSAYTLVNPPCSPCSRCGARLCRRCFTSSCTVPTPCGRLALPFVPRAASTCDACGPESEREARFAATALPFLAAGALVTRVQPSLLGEATSQVLLSLVPRERALRFASMHLTPEGRPRDSGTVSLDDVAELRSGATAAAGAGLQRALLGGASASASSASSSSSAAAVAAPPYAPALVLHLVSARNRTVFVCACPDERTFKRWSSGLTEALALAKSKHSSLFPTAGARAAAAASATSAAAAAAAAGAAKSAELARRQAERDAFKERLGLAGAGGGGGGASAGPRPPGTNPAALGGAGSASASAPAPAVSLSGEALESLGRPAGRGVPAAALGALARREGGGASLAPMPIATSAAQAQAQAAQEAATVALSRAASALRGGFALFRQSLEASVPPAR